MWRKFFQRRIFRYSDTFDTNCCWIRLGTKSPTDYKKACVRNVGGWRGEPAWAPIRKLSIHLVLRACVLPAMWPFGLTASNRPNVKEMRHVNQRKAGGANARGGHFGGHRKREPSSLSSTIGMEGASQRRKARTCMLEWKECCYDWLMGDLP